MRGTPSGLPARSSEDFESRILVDCPACGGLAAVSRVAGSDGDGEVRRMVCTVCPKRLQETGATSPTLGLAPRLVVETRHGALVALNEDHLDYIAQYVAGRLRREMVSPGGVRNRSVISRLPAWAKSARHRDEIARAIDRVRKTRL